MKKSKKKLSRWQALKKTLKIKHLIVIILLVVSNSLAWFIYATRVDTDMNAHVRAWDVLFQAGDSPIINYVDINVESMYPGMTEYYYEIKASNKSEVGATLTYTLLEANIIGEQYITVEGKQENKQELLGTEYTSAELLTMLEEDYPFSIVIALTADEMEAGIGSASYEITVNWPFESGDDELDTYWGMRAADYKKLNPSKPSIALKVKIYITQAID